MATVEVKNLEGQTLRDLQIADEIFGARPNQSLLWESVKQFLASERRGTHATKSRGEVRGGGKKPWRQKGTGRARAGSIRSSLWRHGSIAHGPQPRDYSYALPKGMLRGALRAALATKFQEHKLTVVDQFNLGEPKTKGFTGALAKLGLEQGVLVVDDAVNSNLKLSSRNVKGCDLVRRHELHPYHVLSHNQLLISEGALTRLQEALR
ncbi:MAG: 50S ribosomal protein L4 [Acidobacteriota bacterium]|jgi:large subunit ribosomal protein L4|nr:50S ribosomal protein L4 [Acidobacteriota bacterium]